MDKEKMLRSLVVDPHFSISKEYMSIFTRLVADDTRAQACEDFQRRLEASRVEALMSVLAWSGDCSGMDCNSFIFALYDEWFDPLTPRVLWKVHICNNGLDKSSQDTALLYTALARVIMEATQKGDKEYLRQLETSTPDGAQEHFNEIVRTAHDRDVPFVVETADGLLATATRS
jgi:hypothetical protein